MDGEGDSHVLPRERAPGCKARDGQRIAPASRVRRRTHVMRAQRAP